MGNRVEEIDQLDTVVLMWSIWYDQLYGPTLFDQLWFWSTLSNHLDLINLNFVHQVGFINLILSTWYTQSNLPCLICLSLTGQFLATWSNQLNLTNWSKILDLTNLSWSNWFYMINLDWLTESDKLYLINWIWATQFFLTLFD